MLKIESVVWLDEIVEKLWQKHRVTEAEVAQILSGRPRFRFVERGHREREDVYSASGQTDSGRYLIVFFVLKPNGDALIVSARNMSSAERRRHGEK
jgi:uncharacterized protein